MIGTIVKPSIGLSPAELAELVGELAAAGIDFIKDDELQGNGPAAPLAERVARRDAGARAARRPHRRQADVRVQHHRRHRTGSRRTTTSSSRPAAPASWRASTSSASPGSSSSAATRACRSTATARCSARSAGRSRSASRSAPGRSSPGSSGADHLHTNGISNKFYESDAEVLDSIAAVREPLLGLTPTVPVLSSGQWGGLAHATYAAVGHDRPARARRRRHPRSSRRGCGRRDEHARGVGVRRARRDRPPRRSRPRPHCAGRPRRSARCGHDASIPGQLGSRSCRDCEPPSTATTSPAASTRCCSSRAGAGRGGCSSACRRRDALERAAAEVDVVGIAGIARSLPTAELEAEVRPVLEALVALEPQFVQYKACSTADSSPSIGSIGRVLEIGREVVGDADRPAALRPARLRPLHAARRALRRGGRHRLPPRPAADDVDAPLHPDDRIRPRGALRAARRTCRSGAFRSRHTATTSPTSFADRMPRPSCWMRRSTSTSSRSGTRSPGSTRPVFAIGSGGLSHAIAAADGAARDLALPTHGDAAGPVLAVSGSRSAQTRRQMDAAAAAGWFDPAARARGVARGRAAGLGAVGAAGRAERRAHLGRRRPVRARTARRSRPSPRPRRRWPPARPPPAPPGG